MQPVNRIINYLIASVWFINGLFCKILNLVPRHQQIVARILGENHSRLLTVAIGVSEVLMALWIISGMKSRLNAFIQIIIIASMNMLEFIMAPDLLLWGEGNAVFAFLFILLIWFNEFRLRKKIQSA
jgi:uncharacterized membrane protein YphA (DoxX/SURF4 family)